MKHLQKIYDQIKKYPKLIFLGMFIILLLSFSRIIYSIINPPIQAQKNNLDSLIALPQKSSLSKEFNETFLKYQKAKFLMEKLKDTTYLKDTIKMKKLNKELDKLLKR